VETAAVKMIDEYYSLRHCPPSMLDTDQVTYGI